MGLEPSSTPAAYRARRFQTSPLTHFAASPLRKRSRSVRLLGCKRPRGGSLSLPTFCEKKRRHERGLAQRSKKSRKSGIPKIFSGTAREQFLSLLLLLNPPFGWKKSSAAISAAHPQNIRKIKCPPINRLTRFGYTDTKMLSTEN